MPKRKTGTLHVRRCLSPTSRGVAPPSITSSMKDVNIAAFSHQHLGADFNSSEGVILPRLLAGGSIASHNYGGCHVVRAQ